jgi:hypothetical protein
MMQIEDGSMTGEEFYARAQRENPLLPKWEALDDAGRAVWKDFANGFAVKEVSDGAKASVAPPLNPRTTP